MNGQDKVLDHTREQLSALFDGELALDEARFLQRRLQHDASLAGCVSRWQAIGDALRGQGSAALAPPGFSERVAAAVGAEATPAPARRAGLLRGWAPGAALAASVALVAFFAMRQSPTPAPGSGSQAAQVAQASVPEASPAATPTRAPAQPSPQAPGQEAAQLAAAVAVAEVPRRAASRRTPAARGQAQRAATTRVARNAASTAPQPQYAIATTAPAGATLQAAVATATDNPFAPSAAAQPPAVARPWPRALLPNAGGVFNVGYGSLQDSHLQGTGDAFHPFRPRVATGGQAVQDAPDAPAP